MSAMPLSPANSLSADDLAARFNLRNDPQFEAALTAIDAANYGDFSPDEGGAPKRRKSGAQTLEDLRLMAKTAREIVLRASTSFKGGTELAYADYGGVNLLPPLRSAVIMLATVEERKAPLQSTDALAALVVKTLAAEWLRVLGPRDVDQLRNFVHDAVQGRRDFQANVLDAAISAASISWRVPAGDKPRHPASYPPHGWITLRVSEHFGGLSDEVIGLLPEPLRTRAESWAERGSALVAEYKDSASGGQLMIVANTCIAVGSAEQAALSLTTGQDEWIAAAIPAGFTEMIEWARAHMRQPLLS